MSEQVSIDFSQSSGVICDSCGNSLFTQVYFLRKFSKFLLGEAEDMYAPIVAYTCAKCGKVHVGSIHPGMKALLAAEVSSKIEESSDGEDNEGGAKIIQMYEPK